jgi:hypothetical protein
MTERPVPSPDPPQLEEHLAAPTEPATWRLNPQRIRTAEAARRFGRAERTMRSRALDHPGVAETEGGDYLFHVPRMKMLRANDTGSLDDDIHGRMTGRLVSYYSDTGIDPSAA